jgi:hypothetical protein
MEALATREAAARGRVEELRGRLEVAEAEVSRLVVTGETVDELLAAPAALASWTPGPVELIESVPVAGLARAAALLVGAEAGGDATVTSPACRQIVVVFAEKDAALRCTDVLAGLGQGEPTASQVETMRSKLKRLSERGVLVESAPGLFALAGSGQR